MKDLTKNTLFWLAAGVGACCATRALIRSSRRIDLNGRVALVTGGSRGLGLVLARQLAQEGMRLVICARDSDELERAWTELEQRTEVLAVPCDLRERSRIGELVQTALARFGNIECSSTTRA
jgi:NAD(P)-dependent dehydrogenase (short-subunit alcohol dehydrogenase family)